MEKDLFLTPMQIYKKLMDVKYQYDLEEEVYDFSDYVDSHTNIVVNSNPSYDEAIEWIRQVEMDTLPSYD